MTVPDRQKVFDSKIRPWVEELIGKVAELRTQQGWTDAETAEMLARQELPEAWWDHVAEDQP